MRTEAHDLLGRLKAFRGDPSVTITVNTARTYMDAGSMREHMRELEHKAERLMLEHYDKRTAAPVIEHVRALIAGTKMVGHLPGMVLFVNKNLSEMVQLPFVLRENVSVGASFRTRELLRATLESMDYHVLVLSSEHARLLEASNGYLVGELGGAFPIRNSHYITDAAQVTDARAQDDQQRRYHREVDRLVRDVVGPNGHVVVACVQKQFGHFMKTVERAGIYRDHLKGGYDHVRQEEVVHEAWQIMHEEQKRKHLHELERAAQGTRDLFSMSPDEIRSHVIDGRGHVLFVERDKRQAATLANGEMVLVDEGADHGPGMDLIDAIIEEQIEHGGEVRILPNGSMKEYGGLALKMRY